MKKQVFTIEIDSSDYAEPISVTYLMAMLRMGFSEANMSDLSILSIEENNVEQNVERPKNQQKMLDLLRRASDSLNSYRAELDGDYNDSLAMEIQDFLDGKQ